MDPAERLDADPVEEVLLAGDVVVERRLVDAEPGGEFPSGAGSVAALTEEPGRFREHPRRRALDPLGSWLFDHFVRSSPVGRSLGGRSAPNGVYRAPG